MTAAATVPDLILAQASRSPGAVAVEAAGDRLTYAQLVAQAAGLAAHLRGLGVGPGALVAVALPRGVDVVPALLGVHLAGAAYVPLDPEHPADRLGYILGDAGARVLVTADATGCPGLSAGARVHLDDVAVATGPVAPGGVDPDATAYCIYTSGSTGRPKGVQVSHRALANFVASMRERPGLPDDVVMPAVTTVSFDIAGLELFLPLVSGGRVVVAREAETSDPRQLLALLQRTGARVLQATPVTWRLLLETGWTPPPGFTVLCGGERLPAELAERLLGDGVVLWDLYGPTETTIWSAVTRYERGVATEFHPVRDTTLHLLDETLTPVADGSAGELYIGGAGLAIGYLGRAGLTAARFVADPFAATPGARLYRTGDLARRHPGGRVEILGRVDDQLKIRGFRIEPGEIENVLARHAEVAEAAVRAVDDLATAPRLVAYVRPTDPASPPDPRRLRAHVARSLPAYMLPAQFVVLDAFPRTKNGKLDRGALPAPASVGSEPARPVAATSTSAGSPTERRVAEVLAEVLERPEIDPHDDFFAIGGDSLRAVQAILRLNTELNRQVPINALFEARTVYGLALLLDGDGTPEPQLVRLPHGAPARLSTAQWRLWLHQQRAPESAADNHAIAIPLPDPLDVPALEAALTGLLARHDILRTRYEYDDYGQPVPVVQPLASVRLDVEYGDAAAMLAADVARAFDLAAEPPLRLRLVCPDGGGPAVLLVVVHAIAADSRSRELIAKHVRAAYRGRALPDPALRYADYADWQRELAASPTTQRHLDYWRDALAGLEQADLRTDRPRSISRDWRAGTVRFAVPPEVVARLRDVAFDSDAPLPVGLLAAFYAALGSVVTGTDVTVGVPVPGRRRPELDDLVGMFEETAVVRVDLSGQPAYEQVLARVRAAMLAAQEHAVVPIEDVVAAVLDVVATGPEPGRNPLYDVAFAATGVTAEAPGISLPDAPGTKLDLTCRVAERADGGVDGRLEFATQVFDESTVAALADHYVRLLAAVAADPTRPLELTPMLEPA